MNMGQPAPLAGEDETKLSRNARQTIQRQGQLELRETSTS
jgi:hypothetical protein